MYPISTSTLIISALLLTLTLPAAPPEPGLRDLIGVWQAHFNADASRIITRQRGGKVSLWDTVEGRKVDGDLGTAETTGEYVVDDRAQQVLLHLKSGDFRVFELQTGKALSPPISLPVEDVARGFNPDGSALLLTEPNGVCHVFEVLSGKEIATLKLPARSEDLEIDSKPQFSRDGKLLFLLDSLGILHRYNTKTWEETLPTLKHPASPSAYAFGFAIDEAGLRAATFDGPGENGPQGSLQFWDLESARPIGKPITGKNGVSGQFLSHSRFLLSPGRGETRVLALPSLKTAFTLPRHDDVEASKSMVTEGSKEPYIVTWGYDHSVMVKHSDSGAHAGSYSTSAQVSAVLPSSNPNHVWITFDNTAFLSEHHYDNYVVKFDLPKMEIAATLRLQNFIDRAALSPDGNRLLILEGGTDHERVRLFDATTLDELPVTRSPGGKNP